MRPLGRPRKHSGEEHALTWFVGLVGLLLVFAPFTSAFAIPRGLDLLCTATGLTILMTVAQRVLSHHTVRKGSRWLCARCASNHFSILFAAILNYVHMETLRELVRNREYIVLILTAFIIIQPIHGVWSRVADRRPWWEKALIAFLAVSGCFAWYYYLTG